MPRGKPNYYRVANGAGGDVQPVDDEVERRLKHQALRHRIMAAQDQLVAALGDQRHLYSALEELLAERNSALDEGYFNVGFEHGLLQGRTDAMAALWRKSARGQAFAAGLAKLVAEAGLHARPAAAVLLEVAWSQLVARQPMGKRSG